ncbi:hypothetical protein [Aeromicrobium sp. 179-A 4D2 NHS]|uniref:hypothetical protein n=1 Tax=Aeromicrobium sp. 179-A 4D2 NHS TaxID=3142375 RepID=UPI0039A2F427
MDRAAFEADVHENINDGKYTDRRTVGDCTFTIGETWLGTLYGFESVADGKGWCRVFDTEAAQQEWFHSAVPS